MSKPIKNLIAKTYQGLFGEIDGAVLVDVRGVASNDNNALRAGLNEKGIRVTVVKNTIARRAFEGTPMESINELLDGPSALVYGGESVVHVARELIDVVKKTENLEFKGALMEGQLFGPDQVEALSKFPTREEALAEVVQLVVSPASQLVSAIGGPGGQIASILASIEEKKKDE